MTDVVWPAAVKMLFINITSVQTGKGHVFDKVRDIRQLAFVLLSGKTIELYTLTSKASRSSMMLDVNLGFR